MRNTGASFGIGAGHPVVITLVAAPLLAAVIGGAAGNLADRLLRSPGFGRGAVVDRIHLAGYPPTFNVADVATRLGAIGALAAVLLS